MAADLPRKVSQRDREPDAAADWLLDADASQKPQQRVGDSGLASNPDDVFELADASGVDPSTPPVASASAHPAPQAAEIATSAATFAQPPHESSALVEEVWSRQAEWGPTLLVVGGWLALILVVFYIAAGWELYGVAILALIVGALVGLVLSYPVLITLERPVRITPEQAVCDYYGALSHHFPHFRRMWLLLSSAGRISSAYGSYEGFKAYWTQRLRQLREGRAGALTPLVFEIADFVAEKGAGRNRVEAEFKVKVSIRGRRSAGAFHTSSMKIALVRGPDKMWYLESGMLPLEKGS